MIDRRRQKKHYNLIKDFNTFIYKAFIKSWKKTFLLLMFTCFHYRRILMRHVKDCFKINGKYKSNTLKISIC